MRAIFSNGLLRFFRQESLAACEFAHERFGDDQNQEGNGYGHGHENWIGQSHVGFGLRKCQAKKEDGHGRVLNTRFDADGNRLFSITNADQGQDGATNEAEPGEKTTGQDCFEINDMKYVHIDIN